MKTAFIICFCLFFVGCKSNKNKISDTNVEVVTDTILIDSSGKIIKSSNNEPQFIWHIYGTEPFWNFYIHNDTFLFIRVNEKIDSLYFTMESSYDINGIGKFKLKNKLNSQIAYLNLYPENTSCNNKINDKKFPWWRTEFIYENDTLNGCAQEK